MFHLKQLCFEQKQITLSPMTSILLLSDTHSYLDPRLQKHIASVDEVWHAGDIGNISICDQITDINPNLRVVYGNIDDQTIRAEYSKELFFEVEQVKVYMTHIGGYPPRYRGKIREIIKQSNCKLFICGHSHMLKVMHDHELNCLHMNPGAAGKHGFHHLQTALKFKLNKGNIEQLEIIELEK